MILEMLKHYFSSKNFEVQSFSEPILCPHDKGTGSCQNPCADIIITDYAMPRITGIELLDSQTKYGCAIHVKNKAIISGELPDKYRDQMKGLVHTFFQKPLHMRDLYEWTKECIGRINLSLPLGNYSQTDGEEAS